MKKIITYILVCAFMISPIHAQSKETILVYIEGHEALYIAELYSDEIKIKEVNTKLYLPLVCLANESSTIESVDFNNSYSCLIDSLSDAFNIKIDHYVSLNLAKLLQELDLDYPKDGSINTMNKLCTKIKDEIGISEILNYKDYVETSLGFDDLYDFYKLSKSDIEITQHTLNYIIFEDTYIALQQEFLQVP